MLDFQIFKVDVHTRTQGDLLDPNKSRQDALREALVANTKVTTSRGGVWHTGNHHSIGADCLYFRLGKESKAALPQYDESHHEFVDLHHETAPYTHVIADVPNELVAIAKKDSLSGTTQRLANRLNDLLNQAASELSFTFDFEVRPVFDPDQLIRELGEAYCINRFWYNFSKPNPPNVHQLYVKPMQDLAKAIDASYGTTTVKGGKLNHTAAEQLARSSAAVGNNAGASIQHGPDQKSVSRNLQGTPASVSHQDIDSDEGVRSFFEKLRSTYRRIRHGEE